MKKVVLTAFLSVVLLSGCSLTKSGIIQVDNKVITKSQFDKAMNEEIDNSPFKALGGANNFVKSDDNFMYVIYKEKVVKELIIKTLLDSEIEKRGIKVSDEDLKSELKMTIDKVGSKEELNKILKQRGISNSEFTEDLKTQIRIKKLINSISNIKISDSDAQKYYNSNLDKFKHPEQVRAKAYDIVLNGNELGGGSVRIFQNHVQEKMFEVLGFSKEDAYDRFGFLLNAFKYGVPPHAGLAFGLDRMIMLLAKNDNIRDVIAFPKVKDASCLMTDAPNVVDAKQLDELALDISKANKENE